MFDINRSNRLRHLVRSSPRNSGIAAEWLSDELAAIESSSDLTEEFLNKFDSGKLFTNPNSSAVAFVIGITNDPPTRYPDSLIVRRGKPPSCADIDLDFETSRREELINYTIEKYGRDRVAQVITFSEMKARSAVRDAARILGLPPQVGDKISKAMPPLHMGEQTPLKDCFTHSDRYDFGYKNAEDLRNLYNTDPEAAQVIDIAQGLEGLIRQDGIGAAAVVVSPEPLTNLVPVQKKPDSPLVTQFDKKTIEELGLLKMDFLGLRNLDIIRDTIDMIGLDVEISDNYDDPETYRLLCKADTVGVFQLSESGMRALLRRMQPESLDDIAAVLALYRPGPMASNMHNDYADRKNFRQPVTYFHPDAEDILKNTWGICLYQEQVMKIAQKFAGYTMAEADTLRSIIGKKQRDKMAEERDVFIERCVGQGYGKVFAEDLFEMIEGFSAYSFNQSHSFLYSVISYQTAYLKAHYPAQFMAATCASVSDDIEKTSLYLYEAKRMGLQVSTPDINLSEYNFTANDNEILVGLGALKFVGRAAEDTLTARNADGPFVDIFDFVRRVNPNLRELKSLAQGGALDAFGTRLGICTVAEELLVQGRKDRKAQPDSLFDTDEFLEFSIPTQEYSQNQRMALEKQAVGIYVSGHPLDGMRPLDFMVIDLDDQEGQWVDVLVVVSEVEVRYTKAGAKMATLLLEDQTGSFEAVVFPKTFEKINVPTVGDIIKVGLRVGRDRDEERSYVVNRWERVNVDTVEEVEGDVFKLMMPKGFAQDSGALSQLKSILLTHKGSVPVGIYITKSTTLVLSDEFYVDNTEQMRNEIKTLFLSYAAR